MSKLIIKSSKQWRPFTYRSDVPKKVLASEFDWLDEDSGFDGFFKYKNNWYHTSQFTHINHAAHDSSWEEWDGVLHDSAWTGVLIKLSSDGEEYRVGTYRS